MVARSPDSRYAPAMQMTFIKSVGRIEDLPENAKIQIAFVGRSNVGKSTLINHLANQKSLARVSANPGRTQTLNLFDVDGRFYLVDLPGYGFANASQTKREGFSDLLTDYLSKVPNLKLVFLLIDARLGLTDLDRHALDFLAEGDAHIVLVLNKIDKLSRAEIADLVSTVKAGYPTIPMIQHTSRDKKGRGEIVDTMLKALQGTKK